MFGSVGNAISALFTVGVIFFLIFLALRWVMCWYWKINETLAVLEEIRSLLKRGNGMQAEILEALQAGAKGSAQPTEDNG